MATIFAFSPINFDDFDFNKVVAGAYFSQLYDNANFILNGKTYSDAVEVDWIDGASIFSSIFAGNNLTQSGGAITGGTVAAYYESVWNGNAWVRTWGVEGISVSAVQLYNAFITADGADDVVIIQQILSGNDNIVGSPFNDILRGYSGNDVIQGKGGADALDGGGGVDTASYAASTLGVDVSLATGTGTGGDAEGDTLVNFENLTGSSLDDTLQGNGGNNVLTGGAGSDTVSYAHAGAGVTVSLGLATAQNTVGAGTDTLTGFENLTGSDFNDTLTGDSLANILTGNDGNDTLNGGVGA
ncbi:hypothetical protein JQ599_32120, partial [Bradyrhizobium diazoefficiens]|nr:hypothetical protein [Bradyrhizobium diazoefficiens]